MSALTDLSSAPHSTSMRKSWMPPVQWVVGVIAFLAVSSTLQAWRLTVISEKSYQLAAVDLGKLLLLNIAYWTIPALLLPTIVAIAHRFRFDNGARLRAFAAHLASAVTF